LFDKLSFSVGSSVSAKRQKAWKRVVRTPELAVPKELSLSASDEVLAIGSCFVNEIRAVLERAQLNVHPAIDPQLGELFVDQVKSDSAWGAWDEREHYQCFTPFTVRQEMEVAFGIREHDPDAILTRRFKGRSVLVDPYRRLVYARSKSDLLEIRRRMNQQLRLGLEKSEILIITLGLVEAFKLKAFDVYLSEYRSLIGDEHIEFVNGTYEQALEAITVSLDLIRSVYPQKKIVLTVSPIPISRTFSETDAITATMRGKSILRSCVDTLLQQYDNLYYWPSYEFAMWSDNVFREDDLRHLRPEAVAAITTAFCRAFFTDDVAERVASLSWIGNATPSRNRWHKLVDQLSRPLRRAG